MRLFYGLLSVIGFLCMPLTSFVRAAFAPPVAALPGHLHLVASTPRSIVETRRMGLA